MQSDYQFTFSQLDEFVQQVWDEIYGLERKARCNYNGSADRSATQVDLLHPYGSLFYTPYHVTIGIKSLVKNMYGEYVRNDDFVHVLRSSFHELQHVRLLSHDYMDPSVSVNIKDMSRVTIASYFFPEYYKLGYFRNPEELSCELYSMERLEQFFNTNNVDFDWQSIVLTEANDIYGFIGYAPDYQSMKAQYARHKGIAYYEPRINGTVSSLSEFSASYNELDHCGVLTCILDAPNGVEEVNIINNYIAEHHPEYFRGFQCIKDEYKINNLRNRVEDFADLLLDIKPQDNSDDFGLGE